MISTNSPRFLIFSRPSNINGLSQAITTNKIYPNSKIICILIATILFAIIMDIFLKKKSETKSFLDKKALFEIGFDVAVGLVKIGDD